MRNNDEPSSSIKFSSFELDFMFINIINVIEHLRAVIGVKPMRILDLFMAFYNLEEKDVHLIVDIHNGLNTYNEVDKFTFDAFCNVLHKIANKNSLSFVDVYSHLIVMFSNMIEKHPTSDHIDDYRSLIKNEKIIPTTMKPSEYYEFKHPCEDFPSFHVYLPNEHPHFWDYDGVSYNIFESWLENNKHEHSNCTVCYPVIKIQQNNS